MVAFSRSRVRAVLSVSLALALAVAVLAPIDAGQAAAEEKGTFYPKIKVKSPNGDEVIFAGSSVPIRWRARGPVGPKVRILLLEDDSPVELIKRRTNNDGRYVWDVPSDLDPGVDYKVEVIDLATGARDRSDDTFSIVNL